MNIHEANLRLARLIDVCRKKIGAGTDIPFLGFEYDSNAAALMEIVLQHAEALRELAKEEERFFFAASSCARSAMEAAVVLAWILDPKDKAQKEGRWLGYYETMIKFHRIMSKELVDVDPAIDEDAAKLRDAHEIVRNRKIDGKDIPIQAKPSMEQMMASTGYGPLYSSYRELCQIVHVGPEMVFRFKQGVQFDNGLSGYRITRRMLGSEWTVPFLATGWSVALAVIATLTELGDSSSNLRDIHEAQKALMDYVKNE